MLTPFIVSFHHLLAETKFVECDNCRHFFLVLSEQGFESPKQDHQYTPSPKKVNARKCIYIPSLIIEVITCMFV